MKKSLLIFMLLVLVVALVACGGEKTPEVTEGEDTPAVTTVGEETPAATTTAAPKTTTTAAPKTTTAAPVAPATPAKVSIEKADGSKVDVSVFAVIPYKENISMEFTESKNADGVTVYAPADPIFSSSAAKFPSDDVKSYSKAGANVEEKIYCKGNLSFAWDGKFIYVACDVYDPTLMTRDDAYFLNEINPAYNDTFELYYSFNKYPEKSTRKIAKIDAFGRRVFAAKSGEKSAYFNEITFTHKMSKEANSYYIIYKIPAMTEAGIEMKAGDCAAVSNQINDLRSLEDVDNFFCSGGLMQYDTLWKFLVLGGK